MGYHLVRAGEDIHTIAHDHGFSDGKTLFDHPNNRELRALREHGEILHPGDRLFIPEREPRTVQRPTGAHHRFQVRRPVRRLKLKLVDPHGEPLANEEYRLAIAGVERTGRTDGNGALDERVPNDASEGTLTVAGVSHRLMLGHLNPMEQTDDGGLSGVQARLANLGYYRGPADGRASEATSAAIRAFCRASSLHESDELTPALRDKLRDKHGC